jgi:hypothetical protein
MFGRRERETSPEPQAADTELSAEAVAKLASTEIAQLYNKYGSGVARIDASRQEVYDSLVRSGGTLPEKTLNEMQAQFDALAAEKQALLDQQQVVRQGFLQRTRLDEGSMSKLFELHDPKTTVIAPHKESGWSEVLIDRTVAGNNEEGIRLTRDRCEAERWVNYELVRPGGFVEIRTDLEGAVKSLHHYQQEEGRVNSTRYSSSTDNYRPDIFASLTTSEYAADEYGAVVRDDSNKSHFDTRLDHMIDFIDGINEDLGRTAKEVEARHTYAEAEAEGGIEERPVA